MDIPSELRYTEEHEWVRAEGDHAVVGITDYAQGELGDVVYLELPDVGARFKQMEVLGTIEAVKTVAEIFSPVSGEVVEVNGKLEDEPELVNSSPYGDGWMVRIRMDDPSELESLLSADGYQSLIS